MITVASPLPQSGKSSIAANLAFELGKNLRVCLVDADFAQPSLHHMFSIPHAPASLTALCRLAHQERLSDSEFENLTLELVVPGSKVTLVAGNANPSASQLINLSSFETLLELLSLKYDQVVVDLGTPNPKTRDLEDAVFSRSDAIVTVCRADQISISRFINALEDYSQQVDFERVELVVNQLRDSVLGANPEFQISDTLSKHTPFAKPLFVPWDSAFDAALLKGVPLAYVGKKSQASLAIHSLANQLSSKVAKSPIT